MDLGDGGTRVFDSAFKVVAATGNTKCRAVKAFTDFDRVGYGDTLNDRFHDERGWVSVVRDSPAAVEVVGFISPGYGGSSGSGSSHRRGLNQPIGSDFGDEGLINQSFGQENTPVVVGPLCGGHGRPRRGNAQNIDCPVFAIVVHNGGLDGIITLDRVVNTGAVDGFEDFRHEHGRQNGDHG